MSRRIDAEIAAITAEREAIKHSSERADAAAEEQKSRKPWVESLVQYVSNRREQNGFGEDFQIAQTRRF